MLKCVEMFVKVEATIATSWPVVSSMALTTSACVPATWSAMEFSAQVTKCSNELDSRLKTSQPRSVSGYDVIKGLLSSHLQLQNMQLMG